MRGLIFAEEFKAEHLKKFAWFKFKYNTTFFEKVHPSFVMLGSDNALSLDMSDASPGLYSNTHKSLEQAVAKQLASSLTRNKVCSRHV